MHGGHEQMATIFQCFLLKKNGIIMIQTSLNFIVESNQTKANIGLRQLFVTNKHGYHYMSQW